MSRGAEIRRVLSEVKVEAKKITWPDLNETVQATLVVLVMVIFVALFLWLTDSLLSWLVQKVI